MSRLAVILVVFLIAISTANAVYFKNQATNSRMDSNPAGSVYSLGPNGGNFQRWNLVNTINGCVRFVNAATGHCLDSNGAGQVYTLGCNGGNFQNWRFNYLRLVNCQTGRCLYPNGAGNVSTISCRSKIGGQNWIDA